MDKKAFDQSLQESLGWPKLPAAFKKKVAWYKALTWTEKERSLLAGNIEAEAKRLSEASKKK